MVMFTTRKSEAGGHSPDVRRLLTERSQKNIRAVTPGVGALRRVDSVRARAGEPCNVNAKRRQQMSVELPCTHRTLSFLKVFFFFCCPNNPQGLRASWNPSVNSDCSLSISLFPGLAADTTCQSSYASRFPCGTAAPRRYFLTRATSLARLKKK